MKRSDQHPTVDELVDAPARGGHLEHCATCRDRRAALLAVRDGVAALPRATDPSVAVLELLAVPAVGRVRWSWIGLAAVLMLALALPAALLYTRPPVDRGLAGEIALDHLHYEHRDDAAEISGDIAAIEAFFTETLAFAPGFASIEATSIVGGKRCRIGGQWSALVWLDRADHRLSLFAIPDDVVRARGCVESEGVRVCGTPDRRGGSRILAGALPEPEMLRLLDESMP